MLSRYLMRVGHIIRIREKRVSYRTVEMKEISIMGGQYKSSFMEIGCTA
jgi:hypothetical protein